MPNQNDRSREKPSSVMFKVISVALLISGIALIFVGCCISNNVGAVCLSIGGSLVASAIASIYLGISDRQKEQENDEILEKIVGLLENNCPDGRVCFGRHLTNVFKKMFQGHNINDVIHIDVIGLELNRFFNDQFEFLQKYPNLKIRMIVQNPCKEVFKSIIYHEGRNELTVFENIMELTKEIKEYNSKAEEEKQIELYWMNYPSSVTMTRVGENMYVRPRFLKEGEGGDNMFFEKYSSDNERTFSAYMDFFDKAIRFSEKPLKDDDLYNEAQRKLEELREQNNV